MLLIPWQAQAQSATDDAADGEVPSDRESPYRFKTLFRDVREYVTAPIRWDAMDWMYVGGAVAAVAAAHAFDTTVRKSFTSGQTIPLNGKDTHSLTDALPGALAVGGTFFYAWNIDDDGGRSETWSMLEAAGLASATSYVFKFAAGRERPNETTSPNEWRKGGSSFPSLHVSAATAIGFVLAESGGDDLRWVRRIMGYGIAAGTAYLRLKHDEHWLSDTVAGGAIGASTAVFVLNHEHASDHESALRVVPMQGGAMISYTATLH